MPKQKAQIDYSYETKLVASRPIRYALIGAASFFLLLGAVGVITPILPTTPFVLLAAFCYARSSPRFYNWLMNHRWFGPSLRDWVSNRGIRLKSKIIAIATLTITMAVSVLFVVPLMAVKIGMTVVGLAVAIYIASRPNPDKIA